MASLADWRKKRRHDNHSIKYQRIWRTNNEDVLAPSTEKTGSNSYKLRKGAEGMLESSSKNVPEDWNNLQELVNATTTGNKYGKSIPKPRHHELISAPVDTNYKYQ